MENPTEKLPQPDNHAGCAVAEGSALHFDENRLLRSLPPRLRLMQIGMGEKVPQELANLPYVQMGRVADWIERETVAIDNRRYLEIHGKPNNASQQRAD